LQRDTDQGFTTEEAEFQEDRAADAGYGTALDSLDLGDEERVSPAAPAPASRTPALMADAAAEPRQPRRAPSAPSAQDQAPARRPGLFARLFGWLFGSR